MTSSTRDAILVLISMYYLASGAMLTLKRVRSVADDVSLAF